MPRSRVFMTILLLSVLLPGCAPRPPTWPSRSEEPPGGSTWYVEMERYQRSVHGTLSCQECHPGILPGDDTAPHPDTDLLGQDSRSLYDYETCAACHPLEFEAYGQGVHAEAMANPAGVQPETPPPTCGHCHNAHYAIAGTRAELLSSTSETCGTCHLEALESYEHNYHGKAALLGRQTTATCTDCHGAHTVLALYDVGEAVPACRRCHPEADETLAGYRIHAQATLNPDPDDPRADEFRLFFWITLFFTLLVVAVLAFFYTHTGLWFLRSLHERLRKGGRHE